MLLQLLSAAMDSVICFCSPYTGCCCCLYCFPFLLFQQVMVVQSGQDATPASTVTTAFVQQRDLHNSSGTAPVNPLNVSLNMAVETNSSEYQGGIVSWKKDTYNKRVSWGLSLGEEGTTCPVCVCRSFWNQVLDDPKGQHSHTDDCIMYIYLQKTLTVPCGVEMLPSSLGMGPFSMLVETSSDDRFVRRPISVGSGPLRSFLDRLISRSIIACPNSEGIWPVRVFVEDCQTSAVIQEHCVCV